MLDGYGMYLTFKFPASFVESAKIFKREQALHDSNWALLGLLFASRIPRKPWAWWLTRRYPSGWESTTYLSGAPSAEKLQSTRDNTRGASKIRKG